MGVKDTLLTLPNTQNSNIVQRPLNQLTLKVTSHQNSDILLLNPFPIASDVTGQQPQNLAGDRLTGFFFGRFFR